MHRAMHSIALYIIVTATLYLTGMVSGQSPQCTSLGNTTQCLYTGTDMVTSMAGAQLSCNRSGGWLAAFNDDTSLQQLISYINTTSLNSVTTVWVDAKATIGAQWNWIDGVKFNNTVPIPPSYGPVTLNYLSGSTLRYVSYKPYLYARMVNETHHFICNSPGTGGISSTVVNDESLSWFDARQYCISLGGDLAAFDLIPLNSFSSATNSSTEYWIGLVDWQWNWSNGSSVNPTVTKTFEGMPGPDTPMCLALVKSVTSWILSASPCVSTTGTTSYVCNTTNYKSPAAPSITGASNSDTTSAVNSQTPSESVTNWEAPGLVTGGSNALPTTTISNSGVIVADQNPLSKGAIIGISIGVGLTGLIIIGLIVGCLVYKCRQDHDHGRFLDKKAEKRYETLDHSMPIQNDYTSPPEKSTGILDPASVGIYKIPDACKNEEVNRDVVNTTDNEHYEQIR